MLLTAQGSGAAAASRHCSPAQTQITVAFLLLTHRDGQITALTATAAAPVQRNHLPVGGEEEGTIRQVPRLVRAPGTSRVTIPALPCKAKKGI